MVLSSSLFLSMSLVRERENSATSSTLRLWNSDSTLTSSGEEVMAGEEGGDLREDEDVVVTGGMGEGGAREEGGHLADPTPPLSQTACSAFARVEFYFHTQSHSLLG